MNLPTLTDAQKQVVLANYQTMLLHELTQLVFNDPLLDGRSNEAKAVRAFMIGQGLNIRTTQHIKKGSYELASEQKTFVENNTGPEVKAGDLCRDLWPNEKITPLHAKYKAVATYMKELNPNEVDAADEPVSERTYSPPVQMVHIVARINGCVTHRQFRAEDLKPGEEKAFKMLKSYLSTNNFIYQASQYLKQVDRNLFESNFIRYTYDKPDLTPEEVDQYTALCAEMVNVKQTDRMLLLVSAQIEDFFRGDSDQQRLALTWVEAMKEWRQKSEGAKKDCKVLYDKLTESRSERLKGKMAENATVLNLVEGWKDPEKRKQMIDIAEDEKLKDLEEFDRLATMDDLTILVAGMSREDMAH